MSKRIKLMVAVAAIGVALAQPVLAKQGPGAQPDKRIDPTVRSEVIDRVLKKLNELYVFPDVAKKIEMSIKERVMRGEYDKIDSAGEFARTLTDHLQAISRDKHMRVHYRPEAAPEPTGDIGPTPEERARFSEMIRANNYGFERVERLPGNIGYLKFDHFAPPDEAGDTVAAAMSFLTNTSALIVDLRQNGGGSPGMVALFCSYLFDGDPVHLNDLYFRPSNETRQFWTLPHLPGKRYLGKDVYVLTSKRTFSGAEECCYNLQTQKRATLIGETTGGGANPGGTRWVHPHFGIFVPTGRAINPITKTNWEGTGVKPDVEVSADQALKTAHLTALKKAIDRTTDAERKGELERTIKSIESAKS